MDINEIRTNLTETAATLEKRIEKMVAERTAINLQIKEERAELAETQRFLKATKPRANKKVKAQATKATAKASPLETGI